MERWMGQAHTRPDTDGCTIRKGPLNYKRDAGTEGFSQGSAPECIKVPWAEERGLVILLTVAQMSAS